MPDDNVKVMVRSRPMNAREYNEKATNVLVLDKTLSTVTITKPVLVSGAQTGSASGASSLKRTFTFDAVYDEASTQVEVFDTCVKQMVDMCLEGYNSTIFAYGQTGSGKTHTMSGQPDNPGMIPLAFQRIFDFIAKTDNSQFLVRASFMEIYNEDVRDLLTGDAHLQLKENPDKGVYVKDLSDYTVSNESEIDMLMNKGNAVRSVASTSMNAVSSRSHSIFQVVLERMEVIEGRDCIRQGKLNLVDLAGSERQDKTGATGDRLKEAAKINLSLTTLGCVISKLVEGAPHIPYRDSKLTRLLQDSLGGNAKTLMVVACSPASTNYDETMSTLRYADRAKQIKNRARINEDPKDAQIREMRDYIQRLEAQLEDIMRNAGIRIDESGQMVQDTQYDAAGNALASQQRYSAEELAGLQQLKDNLDRAKHRKVKIIRRDPVEGDPGSLKNIEEVIRLAEEDQQRIDQELAAKSQKAEQARRVAEKMAQKLQAFKAKLADKSSIETAARERERELREARQALAERQMAAKELKRRLVAAEHDKQQCQSDMLSAADRLAQSKQALRERRDALANMREEARSLSVEQSKERDNIAADIESMLRLLELRTLTLAQFVPAAFQRALDDACVWDDAAQQWTLRSAELCGNALRGLLAR